MINKIKEYKEHIILTILLSLLWLIAPFVGDAHISTMDKALSVYACKNHYGIYEVSNMGYIICNDNHRPDQVKDSSVDIYKIYKDIDSRTYFGVTLMDWKDYNSDLSK